MMAMRMMGRIFRFLLKAALLPVQIVLTGLICMIDFAGSAFGFIFGGVGGFIILSGLSCLFMSPIDWNLFLKAMIGGMVIGSFPRIVCRFGESVLGGMKGFLARI